MLSKKTILLAEDEEPILIALQRILELTGEYEVVTAIDGLKALDQIKTVIPDLILSDIVMPNMNGLDFCREVRKNPLTKSVPFVFLTAKKEKLVEGMKIGGDDFLMKPFNVEEVLAKMTAIFRRIDQSREQASQHKGRIEDIPVDEMLESCLREKISGELILQREGDVGVVKFENGDIQSIQYRGLGEGEALDALREWEKGTFVVRPLDIKLKKEPQVQAPKIELNIAQQLAQDVWWVGHADEKVKILHNVYLRVFENQDEKISTLIDPGSPLYFNEISAKISHVLGLVENVDIYIPMDAEPDVCLNSMFLRNANKRIICITTSENWEFIKHYEINPKSVKNVEPDKDPVVKLSSGHELKIIPSPYCTKVNSFMTYDTENRVLFSGSIFSSDHFEKGESSNNLFAEKSDWDGMASFHQKNMSSKKAMLNTLDIIKSLNPLPEIIAPRNGKLIQLVNLDFFIKKLNDLEVGFDYYKKHVAPK